MSIIEKTKSFIFMSFHRLMFLTQASKLVTKPLSPIPPYLLIPAAVLNLKAQVSVSHAWVLVLQYPSYKISEIEYFSLVQWLFILLVLA